MVFSPTTTGSASNSEASSIRGPRVCLGKIGLDLSKGEPYLVLASNHPNKQLHLPLQLVVLFPILLPPPIHRSFNPPLHHYFHGGFHTSHPDLHISHCHGDLLQLCLHLLHACAVGHDEFLVLITAQGSCSNTRMSEPNFDKGEFSLNWRELGNGGGRIERIARE